MRKMMKGIKGKISRPALVGLAVLVALAAIGVSYAARSDTLHIKKIKEHHVSTQGCSDPFTWVHSNDDGHEDYEYYLGVYTKLDPGDTADAGDPGSYPPPPAPPNPGDPFPRYDKDVATTTAQLESDPHDITVVIDNAYPYYYPTVFFAMTCLPPATGVIQAIVLDYNSLALTVDYSGIKIGDTILPGEEAVGALHILVNQEAEQNANYTISLSITTICTPAKECGTAYAYYEDYATCFLDPSMADMLKNPPWGWTNGPLSAGTYEFDIYASAGQCDLSKGRLVGMLTILYDGSTATITYDMYGDYTMDETQLYVGSDLLPTKPNGDYTVAPGQYPYQHVPVEPTTDTFVVTGLSGDIYVVAHAVVCWIE